MKCSVFPHAFAHFECQVQTWKIRIGIFKQLDDPDALTVVIEAAVVAHAFSQHLFARMSKRRVSQIVRESDRFREIFIQPNARAMVRLMEATSIECVKPGA